MPYIADIDTVWRGALNKFQLGRNAKWVGTGLINRRESRVGSIPTASTKTGKSSNDPTPPFTSWVVSEAAHSAGGEWGQVLKLIWAGAIHRKTCNMPGYPNWQRRRSQKPYAVGSNPTPGTSYRDVV